MAFDIIITDAGRTALINAAGTGTDALVIDRVGVTATAFAATTATAAIPDEIKRIATIGGEAVAPDVIHLLVRDEGNDAYTVRGFGLYLDDDTLFAVYSQIDPVIDKGAVSILLLALDITLVNADSALITFGDTNFINPPATETVRGVIELATGAETLTGVDDERGITPKKLKDTIIAWFGRIATYWGPDNDGAGSGLDADLLDGLDSGHFAPINNPAFTSGASFQGDITINVPNPQIILNAGGPRIATISDNRLAFFTDGFTFERLTLRQGGKVHVGGVRNLPPGTDFAGSGNFSVIPGSVGGTAISTYDDLNYTAQEFVRSGVGGPTVVGSIFCTDSGTSYNTSSDYRLKENEVPLVGALQRVRRIPVWRFNFKSNPDRTLDGLFAHELAVEIPEAVTGAHNGMIDIGTATTSITLRFGTATDSLGVTRVTDVPEGATPPGWTWEFTYEVTRDLEETDIPESQAPQGWVWTKTGTRPVYQSIDPSKAVPLLLAAVQELADANDALTAQVQALGNPS